MDINTKRNKSKLSMYSKRSALTDNVQYWILIIPALLYIIIFSYLPMVGTILAFKSYRYDLGIFGSEWIGFENFKYFFCSRDAWVITRNTIAYGFTFIILKIVCAVLIAILLYEINNKFTLKFYQTTMIFPHFLSWVIVGYISYILFNSNGVMNGMLNFFGKEPVQWYLDTKYWPFIIPIFNIWKHVGMDCVVYYAALMGLDNAIFEAAEIDGANKLKKIWYITLPSLIPIITILSIMSIGGIIKGDFGLFYQVTGDSKLLYPVTDIIDTYVYRGIRGGDIGASSAVGLFQSVVGLILVCFTNSVVKKINPENSMF